MPPRAVRMVDVFILREEGGCDIEIVVDLIEVRW